MSTSPEESGALASPESVHDVVLTIRTSLGNEANGLGPSGVWSELLDSPELPMGEEGELTALRAPNNFTLTTKFTNGSLEARRDPTRGITVILREPSKESVSRKVWTQIAYVLTISNEGQQTTVAYKNVWGEKIRNHNVLESEEKLPSSPEEIAQRLMRAFDRTFPARRLDIQEDAQKKVGLLARVSGWILGIV